MVRLACPQITPLRRVENAPVLPYEPIACRTCPCLLNPYCRVDFGARAWFCPLWCAAISSVPQPRTRCLPHPEQGPCARTARSCCSEPSLGTWLLQVLQRPKLIVACTQYQHYHSHTMRAAGAATPSRRTTPRLARPCCRPSCTRATRWWNMRRRRRRRRRRQRRPPSCSCWTLRWSRQRSR